MICHLIYFFPIYCEFIVWKAFSGLFVKKLKAVSRKFTLLRGRMLTFLIQVYTYVLYTNVSYWANRKEIFKLIPPPLNRVNFREIAFI